MKFEFPALLNGVVPITQDVSLETLLSEYAKRFPSEKITRVTFENTNLGVILHFDNENQSRTFLWRGEPISETLALTEI